MKIVIVGGGYSGAACALRLGTSIRRHRLPASVTLVNPSDEFVERIRLHQRASGQQLPRRSLSRLLERAGVHFVKEWVTGIDLDGGFVRTREGSLEWDRLVLANGSAIAPPRGRDGNGRVFALNARHAEAINSRLATLPEGAWVSIVGGGLTGIECAAEIKERHSGLQVRLFSRGDLLPGWSAEARNHVFDYCRRHSIDVATNVEVMGVRQGAIDTSSGAHPGDLCIWAAGFSISPLAFKAGLATDDDGKVRVDPQLRSISDPRVYVVGDAVRPALTPGHPLPMGCKSALPTGVLAAENITCELLGRPPRHLDFATPFYCVSLGRNDGLIQWPDKAGGLTGRITTHRAGAWIKETVSRGTWWSLVLESWGIRAVQCLRTQNAPARLESTQAHLQSTPARLGSTPAQAESAPARLERETAAERVNSGNRRSTRPSPLFAPLLAVFGALLTACGGGGGGTITQPPPAPTGPSVSSFTADQPSYFVGTTAKLTAVFERGSGRIEPGNIAVTSSVPVTTPPLSRDTVYRLIVSQGTTNVTRELSLDVQYRGQLRTLAMPFARAEHNAVDLPDGRVLFIGGGDAGITLPTSVYQFDPAKEEFSKLGDLSGGRVAMVTVSLPSGDVLVAHGVQPLPESPRAEVLNGRTGAVTPTAGQPSRTRTYATGTLLADGRVLIAGGTGSAGTASTAEIYEPSTGVFTLLSSTMSVGRYGHSATLLNNGQVLIYGGYTAHGQPAPAELFDPAKLTFTSLPKVEDIVRANHSAVKAGDGRIWILGGEDAEGIPHATVLRFDAESLFTLGPNLDTPRTLLSAAALTDGRVLLSGGIRTFSYRDAHATSELISGPVSRAGGPAMSTPRFTHTSSTLPSGKVLIVGGMNAQLVPLSTAEIFE